MSIEEIAKKYDLSLIVLFGSRAKGDIHAHSDTDVAFLPTQNVSFEEELILIGDMSSVLKTDIDSVNISKASPLLLYNIFKYGKPLYEKEKGLFADYISKSFRMYEETIPLYEARLAML